MGEFASFLHLIHVSALCGGDSPRASSSLHNHGSIFALVLLRACGSPCIAWWLAERQPYPRTASHPGVHVVKTVTR
jgi:hypothetical protein